MRRPIVLIFFLALLAVAVILLHLVPGLDRSLVEVQIRNSLHVIGFGAVAALTIAIMPGGAVARAAMALLVSVAIGAMAESAQKVSGSAFDIEDLYRDAEGAALVVIGWLIWSAADRFGLSTFWRFVSRSIAVLSACAVFIPLTYWGGVFVAARAEAPVIHDFNREWAHYFVSSINSTHSFERTVSEGHLSVTLGGRPRSGVAFAVAARDWRDADHLVFEAWVAHDQPTSLTVHINDRDHVGRFRDSAAGTVIVGQTRETYRISISDVVDELQTSEDIADIRQVVIFGRDRTEGAVLGIDNLRLE